MNNDKHGWTMTNNDKHGWTSMNMDEHGGWDTTLTFLETPFRSLVSPGFSAAGQAGIWGWAARDLWWMPDMVSFSVATTSDPQRRRLTILTRVPLHQQVSLKLKLSQAPHCWGWWAWIIHQYHILFIAQLYIYIWDTPTNRGLTN